MGCTSKLVLIVLIFKINLATKFNLIQLNKNCMVRLSVEIFDKIITS